MIHHRIVKVPTTVVTNEPENHLQVKNHGLNWVNKTASDQQMTRSEKSCAEEAWRWIPRPIAHSVKQRDTPICAAHEET